MRIDDVNQVDNTYKLYKTADELVDEFNIENKENDSELNQIFTEYNKLECENIVRKRRVKNMFSKLSKELDKINKYPAIIDSETCSYMNCLYYYIFLSLIYFALLIYSRNYMTIAIIPIGIYIGYKVGIISDDQI